MKINTVPSLETKRLVLEPMSMKFCSNDYVNWLNDSDVTKFLESGGNYTNEALKVYLKKMISESILFWAIMTKDTNTHIGNIKIDPINERHAIGEYGILMGNKNYWGRGLAKEASMAVISYCFDSLNLRKITLGVIRNNVAAVNLYKSLGFVVEGIHLMHGRYDGEYCDALRMSLFNLKNSEVKNYLIKCQNE